MILETTQHLQLPTTLALPAALDFVQRPDLLLAELDFLSELQYTPSATPDQTGATLRGVLALNVPMMGTVTLPFVSRIAAQKGGAVLMAQPLEAERAWLTITGQGQARPAAEGIALEYQFQFQAHIQLPSQQQWGAKAFEKMVQAAGQRSMAQIAISLPSAFARALHHAEQSNY